MQALARSKTALKRDVIMSVVPMKKLEETSGMGFLTKKSSNWCGPEYALEN